MNQTKEEPKKRVKRKKPKAPRMIIKREFNQAKYVELLNPLM